MTLEVNIIEIDPADAAAFESAFAQATVLLRQANGCEHVALFRCVEHEGRYQVQLRWTTLEDHTVGYREGPIAPQVRAIIAPFIRKAVPMHFEPVALPD